MITRLKSNPTIMMLACALLWSTGGLLLKSIEWNSLVTAGIRSLFCGLVMYAFMKKDGMSLEINKQTLKAGFFYSITTVCYVISNSTTTAANAIVIQSANPIFIIMITALVYKQKINKRDLVVVASCIVGIALFFIDSISGGGMIGNIFALISAVFVALSYNASSKATTQAATMSGIMMGHFVTVLIGVPALVLDTPDFTTQSIVTVVMLGVFQLGLPYVIFSKVIRLAPPLTCSLVGMVEPIANPLWVALAIGEIPGFISLLGGFIVIASVAMWSIANARIQANSATN